ncbi:hypothetical protein B0H34DRAFT_692074 [Crassisporium funariophilum]|nr:hypothetical protein B0H34DRAFT_692074 [Crassisporium funariophilum]
MYYLAFPKDSLRSKILVYGVYLLEVLQTVLTTQVGFHAFAEGFGNLGSLDEIGLTWLAIPVISGIVAFLAETFYAYRIKILSGSNWVAGFIVLLAVIQLGGGIATAIEIKRTVYFSKLLNTRSLITSGIWNGGSFLCDVTIAIFMTYYLSRGRKNSEIKQTKVLLTKIIRLTIETGTITAAIALINFSLALLPGHPPYWETVASVLGKVYSNSMMAVLNSRMSISHETRSEEVDMHMKSLNVVSSLRVRHSGCSVYGSHRASLSVLESHRGVELGKIEEVQFPCRSSALSTVSI